VTPGTARRWRLVGRDGNPYESHEPGALGGHRRSHIYGKLDCRTARAAIARGGYVTDRVFFADEVTAIAAGYRPCAVCMPNEYRAWRKCRSARAARSSDERAQRAE
jgi:methylphosphotriester-DNA--protein-cysteine methyltransferase